MSGGDQMLIQLFKRIAINFDKIDCCTSFDGKKSIEANIEGVTFYLPYRVFDKCPLIINYIFRTIQSLKVMFKKNIDIMYSGSDFFPDVIPAFLYGILHPKTKWVQYVFHIYPDWRKRPGRKIRNFVAQYLQRISFVFIKKSDIVININAQVRRELIKLGFAENKIKVNTPGIDVDYFQKLIVNKRSPKFEATFLGRLNPSKGIFDLIEIWKRVVKESPEARLAIIGGGSQSIVDQLKNRIVNAKLENNVYILGFLENDEAFSIIKKSKIFLFPSYEEGFGIAIAEAMACRVPVVSWDLAVYKESFEDNSIQIEKGDLDLLAMKVVELIKNEGLRSYVVIKARKFVNKYSWDLIAQNHITSLMSNVEK